MSTKTITTTIEILGKPYPIRCPESELKSLQQAADFLNKKMAEVKDSGKAINLERIAIITGLNVAYQLLELDQQKNSFMNKVNQRLSHMQDKLDNAINQSLQTDLIYSSE